MSKPPSLHGLPDYKRNKKGPVITKNFLPTFWEHPCMPASHVRWEPKSHTPKPWKLRNNFFVMAFLKDTSIRNLWLGTGCLGWGRKDSDYAATLGTACASLPNLYKGANCSSLISFTFLKLWILGEFASYVRMLPDVNNDGELCSGFHLLWASISSEFPSPLGFHHQVLSWWKAAFVDG